VLSESKNILGKGKKSLRSLSANSESAQRDSAPVDTGNVLSGNQSRWIMCLVTFFRPYLRHCSCQAKTFADLRSPTDMGFN